jgi:DNA-binding transcriptional LysR family regulator
MAALARLSLAQDLLPVAKLVSDARLLDLRAAGIDLAIRFGRGTYPGYTVTKVMSDFVLPVCATVRSPRSTRC